MTTPDHHYLHCDACGRQLDIDPVQKTSRPVKPGDLIIKRDGVREVEDLTLPKRRREKIKRDAAA